MLSSTFEQARFEQGFEQGEFEQVWVPLNSGDWRVP